MCVFCFPIKKSLCLSLEVAFKVISPGVNQLGKGLMQVSNPLPEAKLAQWQLMVYI